MKNAKFKAMLPVFSAKSIEDGGAGHIVNRLSMPEINTKALAALCEDSDVALTAFEAILASGGRHDQPAGKQLCSLTVTGGKKEHTAQGVVIKKVVLDARGKDRSARIVTQEPKTKTACGFYCDNLGFEIEVAIQPTQARIEDSAKGDKDGDDKEEE